MATLNQIIAKAYGPASGPFGFPMRDDVASEVDRIVKGLPKECREAGFKRVVVSTKAGDFDEDERSDVSYVTTDDKDRDREIVDPKGLDWSQFKKNPVVPFGHEYRALPVGRAAWWKQQAQDVRGKTVRGWIGKTIYATCPATWTGDWFADAVWDMVKNDMLPGKSIGFIPTEMRAPTDKEIQARPDWDGARCIWSKALVLEWSVAPVQSNPNTVVQEVAKMRQKGMKVPDAFLEEMGIMIPEAVVPIDWNALAEHSRKSADALSPPPAPPASLIAAPIQFRTYSEVQRSIASSVLQKLGELNADSMIAESVARRKGRI